MTPTKNCVLTASVAAVIAFTSLPVLAEADDDTEHSASHAVFIMNNSAAKNEVLAFERSDYGTLLSPRAYRTGGRGSGGLVDPLSSQGSLVLSTDRSLLFAVNAGSGTLSVFAVYGAKLELVDEVATEGSEPIAVAQHGDLVYVVNSAGSSSVVGFTLQRGRLKRIPDSQRFLSGNNIGAGSIAFSPDGQHLLVTERVTPSIDVFAVLPDGTLSSVNVNKNVGVGTFSVAFAPNGAALATETGSGGLTSAISSYSIQSNGTLLPISASVPTLGAATCWDVVTPGGTFVYTSNSASSSISGFSISGSGALAALAGTVLGNNPAGSVNLDVTISADGKFLYSLNSGGGTIGMFAIQPGTGTLTNLGTSPGVQANSGFNGIAAN